MIASLAMYDWPEVRTHTDRLWRSIAQALRAEGFTNVPGSLERSMPLTEQWRSPALLFSQSCGYPLTHEFDNFLQVLATPVYGVEGCDDTAYQSLIVVHTDSGFAAPEDLRGAHAVYNAEDSLSGHLALRSVFAPLSSNGLFFGEVSCSGGHANSMKMVAAGAADVAAIDCVSFALCRRYRRQITDCLRIVAHSPAAPSLPYVTCAGRPRRQVDSMKRALASAFSDPYSAADRISLFIEGLEFTSRHTYDRVLVQEAEVRAAGYPDLG